MLARADMQRHDTRVSISVCRLLGLASLTSTAAVDQKRIFLAQSQDIERSSLDPGFLHEIVNTFFVGLLSATQAMKAYISTVRVHVPKYHEQAPPLKVPHPEHTVISVASDHLE